MANTITLKATDGSTVQFVDEVIGSGAMKDVYFSPDKSYVVGFFRTPQDANAKDRLHNITGIYRDKIFNQPGGDYWDKLFCWPTKLVEWEGKLGVVVPAYQKHFFFEGGKFKGKEKIGKWFASAKLRNRFVEHEFKGTWLTHFHMLIQIARAVKRLHAAGLAHSDLSYNNVLVDPKTGTACVIDCDGLVVPGKYPPDVVGTPDFIAPEVLATRSLKIGDPNKKLPSIQTDRHALAVMIYMYLLYRHPLRGGKVNDLDPAKDEELSMGSKALFIEHPYDTSNRPKIANMAPSELPQGDVEKLPYSICGPYLKQLFNKAFIDGLHNPALRPTADEWLTALVKTTDLMQPCQNPNCEAKWFVFDNTTKPRCPFCGTEYHGQLPVLNLYYSPKPGVFKPENYRLMVYHHQSLYMWHVNRFIFPNEKLTAEEKRPVGDFHFHNGKWILINRRLPNLWDKDTDKKIEIGQAVELTEGKKILLGKNDGDRLIVVQLVNN
ncbi:helix-hairpin-helix domain-containing protein [Lepagella muris]|jgi:serine/threonine protein kinase|uniref:Kinase n=1 Tax=Lepagella muris TaxID=3032870 RepID=A0AC61RCJ3_9BACT|nr:lipopolysaccharide kinase InaA family protein [Lepagella muris]TGY75814.1 kinase [Lepagella muris]THG46235.1 kinase [Bacteroidales bacterium]TKC60671.1 kinase [Bacteroidales bacterium]